MQKAGLEGSSATSPEETRQKEEDQEERVEGARSEGWDSGGGEAAGCDPGSSDTSGMRDLDQRSDCRKGWRGNWGDMLPEAQLSLAEKGKSHIKSQAYGMHLAGRWGQEDPWSPLTSQSSFSDDPQVPIRYP